MKLRVAALLTLSVLAAGCGGGGGGSAGGGGGSTSGGGGGCCPSGAKYIPASAGFVFSANTDFGGSQWGTLKKLLGKFPAVPNIDKSLEKVKGALGPETDVVFFDSKTFVVITKPTDKAKFDQLQKQGSSPAPTFDLGDGWVALAKTQATLDKFKQAESGKKLADDSTYKAALDTLPADALITVYLTGAGLGSLTPTTTTTTTSPSTSAALTKSLDWAGIAIRAEDLGLSFDAHVKGAGAKLTTFTPALDKVPGGVIFFDAANNLKQSIGPLLGAIAPSLQKSLPGVTGPEIADLLGGQLTLYVRQGTPFLELTEVSAQSNLNAALATVDKLFGAVANSQKKQIQTTTANGVPAKKIDLSGLALYWGGVDGKLVISSSTTAFADVKNGPSTHITDDPVFKDLKAATGLPGQTSGLVYVNLKDAVALIENLASATGKKIKKTTMDNLAPLYGMLFYGTASGDVATIKGIFSVK